MPAVPSIAAVPDINFSSLTVAQIQLDGSGSSAGSGSSITNYTWQLIYKPPGSSAALADSGTDSQPYLQNIDKPGTYLVFLVVANNVGKSSETNKFLAKDSAFVTIRAKTQYLGLKIPAGHERNWADIVYANHIAFDALANTVGTWDTSHRLYFTTGNSAEIQDNRAANSKAGAWGLKIKSTTGINTSGSAAYHGIYLDPSNNAGNAGGGGGITGVGIHYTNQAIDVTKGEKILNATMLTSSSASHEGIKIADDSGGWNLSYAKIISTSFKGRTTSVHHLDQTYPIAGVWGAAFAESAGENTTQSSVWLSAASAGRLTFDLRTTSTPYYTAAPDNGLITAVTRTGSGAGAAEQDLILARVSRFNDQTNQWVGDTGIGYSEGEASSDANKVNTWFLRSLAPVANGGKDRGIVTLLENRAGAINRVAKPLIVQGYEVISSSSAAQQLSATVTLHADLFNNTSVRDYTVLTWISNTSMSATTQKWGLTSADVHVKHSLNASNQQLTLTASLPPQIIFGNKTVTVSNLAAGGAEVASIDFQVGNANVPGTTPYRGTSASLGKLAFSFNAFTGSAGGGTASVNTTTHTYSAANEYLEDIRVKIKNTDASIAINGNVDLSYEVRTNPYWNAGDDVTVNYLVICGGRY